MDKILFYIRKLWFFAILFAVALVLLWTLLPNLIDSGPNGWMMIVIITGGMFLALLMALRAVWNIKPKQAKARRKSNG